MIYAHFNTGKPMTTKPEMTLENVCFRYDGSKEAKGCIRIMNEKYETFIPSRIIFKGEIGAYYRIYKNKRDVGNELFLRYKLLSPSDYLLLLSAPESQAHTDLGITDKDKVNGIVESQAHLLTEKDLIVGNRFECKEEFIYEGNIFYYKGRIYDCRIGGRIRSANGFDFRFDALTDLNRHFKLDSQPPVMEGKEESDSKLIDTAKKLAKAISDQKQMQDNLEASISKTEKLSEILTVEQANIVQEIMTEVFTEYNKILSSLQSEVEQLKGALQELVDIQNGPPLEQHKNEWQEVMDKCYSILSK